MSETRGYAQLASSVISLVCISAVAIYIPYEYSRLNAAQASIQARMDAFKFTARNIWQDIVLVQSDGRAKRQYGGYDASAAGDSQQCTSCVKLHCPPGPLASAFHDQWLFLRATNWYSVDVDQQFKVTTSQCLLGAG
ncbi:hypothetical protein WR25_25312 [Diploscapter pachys]|uniref:Nematode cuticle collagen N-terminal domain-containing protein n=1 Tax=Diploscapter pachys TaxID=2018661 RepID=A0A2A2JEC5_9BILA|nr:hypothetical protein WR25_25312 [Diploscapter pachys]